MGNETRGKTVKSTRDSAYDFMGKVKGNQLKGKMKGASSSYLSFFLKMPSDTVIMIKKRGWILYP